jgi:hypothetical protein
VYSFPCIVPFVISTAIGYVVDNCQFVINNAISFFFAMQHHLPTARAVPAPPAFPPPTHLLVPGCTIESKARPIKRSSTTANPICTVTGASFAKSRPSVTVFAAKSTQHVLSVEPTKELLDPLANRLDPSATCLGPPRRYRFEISTARRLELLLLRERQMTDLDRIIENTYTWPS